MNIALPVCLGEVFSSKSSTKAPSRMQTTTTALPTAAGRAAECRAAWGVAGAVCLCALMPNSTTSMSQHSGRSSPTGSSTDHPGKTAFPSLAARKSGAFWEFLWGDATSRLSSANLASPQLTGLDTREKFKFFLCCEAVMATRSHSAARGQQTTCLGIQV